MEQDRYKLFCGQVIKAVRGATADEKRDLVRELTAHMEDHADTLVAAGWETEAARQHAVESMGDPAEIGRSYSAELSLFWLVCSWCGHVLRFILILWMIFPMMSACGHIPHRQKMIRAPRVYCQDMIETENVVYAQDMDMEIRAAEHTIQVIRVQILYKEETMQHEAQVIVGVYADQMFRDLSDEFFGSVRIQGHHNTVSGVSYGLGKKRIYVYVTPETEELRLQYEVGGQEYSTIIPLEWEVAS